MSKGTGGGRMDVFSNPSVQRRPFLGRLRIDGASCRRLGFCSDNRHAFVMPLIYG